MLECVVNVCEGRDHALIDELSQAVGPSMVDLHSDRYHNRSVFTLAGRDVEEAARCLTAVAVARLDINRHRGAHPRIGVVDVVPFVPIPNTASTLDEACAARDRFASWAAKALDLPVFVYGSQSVRGPQLVDRPQLSLPEVRKGAFTRLMPNVGPDHPHATAGATAAGAREVLVAYNLWLKDASLSAARLIAGALRDTNLRVLALQLGQDVQISCNLIRPHELGPGAVYDALAAQTPIKRAELVGLIPQQIVDNEPPERWEQLDIGPERTIEARLLLEGHL